MSSFRHKHREYCEWCGQRIPQSIKERSNVPARFCSRQYRPNGSTGCGYRAARAAYYYRREKYMLLSVTMARRFLEREERTA